MKNFYIRAAIEDPRPILRHEGIPGHFLQLSIANHLSDEIRRQHKDSVFVEDWRCIQGSTSEKFRLGQFHDDLIKNGNLPVSVIEWILLDDPSAVQQATK